MMSWLSTEARIEAAEARAERAETQRDALREALTTIRDTASKSGGNPDDRELYAEQELCFMFWTMANAALDGGAAGPGEAE